MKKIIFHAVWIIIITLSAVFTCRLSQPGMPLDNKLCKSTIYYRLDDKNHNFEYNISVTFNFTDTGKGHEHIRGVVIKDEEKFTVARNLGFDFKVKNNNYEITINSVSKLGLDNIPDALVSTYLSYTLPNSLTLLKIHEINDHSILISGLQGPLLICSVS